jgi:hypothetical protein
MGEVFPETLTIIFTAGIYSFPSLPGVGFMVIARMKIRESVPVPIIHGRKVQSSNNGKY